MSHKKVKAISSIMTILMVVTKKYPKLGIFLISSVFSPKNPKKGK